MLDLQVLLLNVASVVAVLWMASVTLFLLIDDDQRRDESGREGI